MCRAATYLCEPLCCWWHKFGQYKMMQKMLKSSHVEVKAYSNINDNFPNVSHFLEYQLIAFHCKFSGKTGSFSYPSNAEATYVLNTRIQRFLKTRFFTSFCIGQISPQMFSVMLVFIGKHFLDFYIIVYWPNKPPDVLCQVGIHWIAFSDFYIILYWPNKAAASEG